MSIGAACPRGSHLFGYRHNCLVVYRRRIWEFWQKTYWVICIYCDQSQGPHRENADAWAVAEAFNHHDTLAARGKGGGQ